MDEAQTRRLVYPASNVLELLLASDVSWDHEPKGSFKRNTVKLFQVFSTAAYISPLSKSVNELTFTFTPPHCLSVPAHKNYILSMAPCLVTVQQLDPIRAGRQQQKMARDVISTVNQKVQ